MKWSRPGGCIAAGKPVELVSFFHDGRHNETTVVVLSLAVPNWLVTDTVWAAAGLLGLIPQHTRLAAAFETVLILPLGTVFWTGLHCCCRGAVAARKPAAGGYWFWSSTALAVFGNCDVDVAVDV